MTPPEAIGLSHELCKALAKSTIGSAEWSYLMDLRQTVIEENNDMTPVAYLRDAHNGEGDECLVPCAKGDPGSFPVYADPVDPVKQLLLQMFKGMGLHEQSYFSDINNLSGGYSRDIMDCYIEACGGDKVRAYFLSLFDHWSNDLIDAARLYGIEVGSEGPGGYEVLEVEPATWEDIFSEPDTDAALVKGGEA